MADGAGDSALAGLGFRFSPVRLKPATDSSLPRDCSGKSPQGGRRGGGAHRAPTAASSGGPKSVAFNLRERRPGPAYSSPDVILAESPAQSSRQHPHQLHKAAAAEHGARHPAGAASRSSLVQLKLASLRRRAPVAAAAAPAAEGFPGRPAAAGTATLLAAAAAPSVAAKAAPKESAPALPPPAAPNVDPAGGTAAAQLLQEMELMLAGCSSQVLEDPPPTVPLPEHVLLGLPVLAVPHRSAATAAEALQHEGAAESECAQARTSGEACSNHFGVLQPASSSAGADPVLSGQAATLGGTPNVPEPEEGGEATLQPRQPSDAQLLPATLEDALQLLGLLARQHSSTAGSACRSSVDGPPQLWLCLRAVQMVLAAKEQTALAGLVPLVRRLRQVRLHLEFHKANLQRGRSRSPRRSSSPGAGPTRPPGPWLSGRSSAQDSKHRHSRSISPSLHPRPKVLAPSLEASELQVQLLGSLRQKLMLKLGLAVLHQAAAAAELRQRLLAHVSAQEAAHLRRTTLLSWHAAVIPSQRMEAEGAELARQMALRRQRAQLSAWWQWATHSGWQRQQLAQAQQQLRRRLLAAGMQHWRCYCQQQLVQRLQAALAARWAAAWGRRRVLVAWRQAARRSAQLKAALLLGRPCSSGSSSGEVALPASQLEALAATAAAFAPVRAFVAEAVEQLAQLQQGLRFCLPGSAASAAAAAAAREQQQLLAEQQEPPPVGSVQSLLALLQPTQQPRAAPELAAVQGTEPAAGPCRPGLPDLDRHACEMAGAAQPSSPAKSPRAAGPAPDPGSPPASYYNPASYASPSKSREQQAQQQRQRQRGQTRHATQASSTRVVESPAAVEAELLECQEQVQQLRKELEQLEEESTGLQRQLTELSEAGSQAVQALQDHRDSCDAAAAGKVTAAVAMQEAVQQHAAAVAEFAQQERQLKQRQQDSQDALAAAAGARAAAHAVAERQALAAMGVQKWTKAVEAAAKELAACHRSQQAPVMVRLKEARQQLERHQLEADAAQQQAPQLAAAAHAAAQQAHQAQQAVLEAQQWLVLAAEQRASCQRQLDAAMGSHEAAAVAAVAAEQEAGAAEQQQRLLEAQQQAVAGRLRQAAQQVLRRQQEAALIQQRVQLLQQRHREAVAAALAADQPHRHQEQQQHRQHRGKLKRRLQVVQEDVEAALDSPTAVQQRRPPPLGAAARCQPAGAERWAGLGAAEEAQAADSTIVAAEQGGMQVMCAPQGSAWSCLSSEPGSPPADLPLPLLTVDDAAARFYSHCLVRRALRILRHEAAATRAALKAADERWCRRQQAAVLQGWRAHAAGAADWLYAASRALRRRWLLRTWRAVVAGRHWQEQAEAKADEFARRRLLAAGLAAWRERLQHEHWRDAVHEAVVLMRMRNMLQSWRSWTQRRRQKAARLRSALAVYHCRLLKAAVQQWRWVQHSKALLHRMFSTALDLWQDEVGVRLHERNHERLQACWGAWQLALLEAQALRRQAILWNAAAAFREKQLLLAGLHAFKQALASAREQQRLARVRVHMFVEWRRLAASSARHWRYEAMRQHRQRRLLRVALAAWQGSAEATSQQLAQFWLRWQVHALLRRALLGWRWAIQAQHEQRVLSGMADVHRERLLQQLGLDAFCANAQAGQAAHSIGYGSGNASGSSSRRGGQLLGSVGPMCGGAAGMHPLQQAAGQHLATVSVTMGRAPPAAQQQQQQQQCQLPLGTSTTTVVISRGARCHEGQEQVPPAAGSVGSHVSRGSCGAAGSAAAAAAAATQGIQEAVSNWRAAADFWRQRHQTYSQQHMPALDAGLPVAAVTPQTAATLAELRAQRL